MRILVVGVYFIYQAARGRNLEGGRLILNKKMRQTKKYHEVGLHTSRRRGLQPISDPGEAFPMQSTDQAQKAQADTRTGEAETGAPLMNEQREADLEAEPAPPKPKTGYGFDSGPPTFLGWAGWAYGGVYFPIVQILWLASNYADDPYSGKIKFVRAIGIGVTALPFTMDTKARYAVVLEQRYGRWANRLFTWTHAVNVLILGAIEATLLILAAIQIPAPIPFVPVYIVFSGVWMFGSFTLFPPLDGGMSPNSIVMFAAGVAMGIFGGAFTSAPAFAMMGQLPNEPGVNLGEFLSCEEASVLSKFLAIFP